MTLHRFSGAPFTGAAAPPKVAGEMTFDQCAHASAHLECLEELWALAAQ